MWARGPPGCLELCSHILFSSEPLATLGSGKLCTGIVLCTFFLFTHVDGVATKEGEGRASEPWASQGASPHGAGLGESQGKVIQARGKSGACQGQARGKSGAPWRLNPKAPSSPPPMVPGAVTQVVSPESQATVYTCPIDHAWGCICGGNGQGQGKCGPGGTPMGAWSFVHTSYFFRATGHPWLWQAVHWHCSVHPFVS